MARGLGGFVTARVSLSWLLDTSSTGRISLHHPSVLRTQSAATLRSDSDQTSGQYVHRWKRHECTHNCAPGRGVIQSSHCILYRLHAIRAKLPLGVSDCFLRTAQATAKHRVHLANTG
jgi:hypothetical protein